MSTHYFESLLKISYNLSWEVRSLRGIDQQYIDGVVKSIRQTLPVHEIILFGSQARGDEKPDSDYDICVIADQLQERKLIMLQKINKALIPYAYNPKDVLLYTQDEFIERAQSRSFERTIEREGVLIYKK